MRQFGLIGYPLSHSFSKKYFADKFEREGLINCSYENYPISSINELTALLKDCPGLEGLNVTIPYKEQVIPFLSGRSAVVEKINACNCIKIENGKLFGHNTDVTGFEISLTPKLKKHHRKALILGTGGAAKAVEYVLSKLGIQSSYVSRTASPGILGYESVSPQLLSEYTLIINTTPLGMYPGISTYPPIPYAAISNRHYLFDLVYNPAKTVFLQNGERFGAAISNGSDMLQIQAEESWKIWNQLTA